MIGGSTIGPVEPVPLALPVPEPCPPEPTPPPGPGPRAEHMLSPETSAADVKTRAERRVSEAIISREYPNRTLRTQNNPRKKSGLRFVPRSDFERARGTSR
jgi:hypothetical protein